MVADPGQTEPINDRQPEVAARLTAAVQAWRKEVLSAPDPSVLAAKDKNGPRAAVANAVDPRPFTVGYREFPITMLEARDGEPNGDVRRSSNAPNCSFFVNWTKKEDSIVWLIDVHTAGRYEVSIDYTCPEADVGSEVALSFRNSRLTGRVASGWDPPLNKNQDTLPRPHGESQLKEFRPLKLGKIQLEQGVAPLTLQALEIPGKSVMDVRRLTVTLLP